MNITSKHHELRNQSETSSGFRTNKGLRPDEAFACLYYQFDHRGAIVRYKSFRSNQLLAYTDYVDRIVDKTPI